MIEEIIINKIDEINEEYNVIVRNSPDNGYKLENIKILAHQKEAMNKVLNELLIEFKNKPDYKSAFEYMYKWFNQKNNKIDTEESLKIEKIVIDFMNEMIKKYNLGGER